MASSVAPYTTIGQTTPVSSTTSVNIQVSSNAQLASTPTAGSATNTNGISMQSEASSSAKNTQATTADQMRPVSSENSANMQISTTVQMAPTTDVNSDSIQSAGSNYFVDSQSTAIAQTTPTFPAGSIGPQNNPSESETSAGLKTFDIGADSISMASSASSTAIGDQSAISMPTTSSLLPSNAVTFTSEQGEVLTNDYPSEASGTLRGISRYLSGGGDSTLSTSVVPAKASRPLAPADVSSDGESARGPIPGSEPNHRHAISRLRYSSTAGDDTQMHGESGGSSSPAVSNSVQPGNQKGVAHETQPAPKGRPKPSASQGGKGQGGKAAQSSPAASVPVQTENQKGKPSNTQPAPQGPPKSNTGQHEQAGPGTPAPKSNAAGKQGNQQSQSSTHSSSDPSFGGAHDSLANGGLAGLTGNASAIARFVQGTIANQTAAQNGALKAQIEADFAEFLDKLFANASSSGQSSSQTAQGSQSQGSQSQGSRSQGSPPQQGSQSPTLQPQPSSSSSSQANQSCSDQVFTQSRLATDIFFIERVLALIYQRYQEVRGMVTEPCA